MARQTVYDEVNVSDLNYSSLGSVIERLIEYKREGYDKFEVEAYEDYGSTVATLRVTRRRLENDEEYANRMRSMEAYRERRRQEYLRLREEFANEEG